MNELIISNYELYIFKLSSFFFFISSSCIYKYSAVICVLYCYSARIYIYIRREINMRIHYNDIMF